MLDRIELHKESIPIQSGDVMVMYSNGVIEAENGYTKQFGIEQLINLVIGNRSLPAYKIVEAIATELKDYAKNKQENADITLVILKRS